MVQSAVDGGCTVLWEPNSKDPLTMARWVALMFHPYSLSSFEADFEPPHNFET
jgi:hypothetical protein